VAVNQGAIGIGGVLRIGWTIKRQSATSHRILSRTGWPDFTFAFHDKEEIGPRMPAHIAKKTGITPDDL
jgi:predicted RNA binding protein YcfA (HicA-like mRNA interferase family)